MIPIVIKDLTGKVDGEIDYLMRIESIQEDVEKVCEIIGIPPVKVPHFNESPKVVEYKFFYDDETAQRILANNYDTINYANYKFD